MVQHACLQNRYSGVRIPPAPQAKKDVCLAELDPAPQDRTSIQEFESPPRLMKEGQPKEGLMKKWVVRGGIVAGILGLIALL